MVIYKNIIQGSDEWHKMRLGKVTGSSLKELMSKDNLSLIDNLIAEIVSEQTEEIYCSPKMQRGTDLEPIARQAYEDYTGFNVEQVGGIQPDRFEWFWLSPDGIINIDGKYKRAVEIKCPDTCTHVKYIRQNKIPSEYKHQVLAYFIANEDLEELDFVSYDNRFLIKPIHIITISRKDLQENINEAVDAMDKFWIKFLDYYQQITF